MKLKPSHKGSAHVRCACPTTIGRGERTAESTWYVVNWSENIPVLDDCVLTVKELLDDEENGY
jgi:hypothetical protein